MYRTLLDLLTPVVLRVDAAGAVQGADAASVAWLEARELKDRSLAAVCGQTSPAALTGATGPWRAVALPGGEHLVIGTTWQTGPAMLARLGRTSLQDKQAVLNVLPERLAEEVAARTLQPKAYSESTVLFVDAVQFSRLAARVDPVSCIRQLDFYFSLFDQITADFMVEKVTSIGDADLAVAGVPQRRAAHAVDATLAALRLAHEVASHPGPVVDEFEWSFRVGLHSGPCISGVIGARRHVFDLWGDTLSVGAHVQRVGRPDRVSVSGATAALIGEFFDVGFDGTTVVRNAGEVEIHVVRGVRPELLADGESGLVNEAFRARYEEVFREQCPEAAWRARDASAVMLGQL